MLLAILFCILKNNARGYPATVTAVDIIDTMYVFVDLFISAINNTTCRFGFSTVQRRNGIKKKNIV